jgi:hypothetical protein
MDEIPPSAAARVLDLLRRAHVERLSGVLHLDRGGERRGLVVREGQVVYAMSDVAGERLGDVLVRHGDVTQDVFGRAEAAARSEGRRLGAVLVDTGIVDTDQLEEAVATHVRTMLYSALDEPGTSPSFEPVETAAEAAAGWIAVSRLSTGQLLLDAVRRLDDPAFVREALGDQDRTLVLTSDQWLRAQPASLTPTDGFVLSRVDGTLSARELVGLIPLPAEETEKSLLGLLCTGAVGFADRPAAQETGSARRADGPAPRAHAGPPASSSAAPPPPAASPTASAGSPHPPAVTKAAPTPEDVRRTILEIHGSLGQRDHFEVLGISPGALDADLRAAFARLARMLHPDACRDPILAEVVEQREAVFARVREAYEALRDPGQRAEYEAELRRRKPHANPPVGSDAEAQPGPESHHPNQPPDQAIASGEELIRDGQYGEAIQLIEGVLPRVEGALRVRAQLALAKASMKYPEWLRRAEAHLQEVLREDPAHVPDPVRLETYLLLGNIYKASDLPVRAAAMYRKALSVQPGNKHATRELAALEGPAPPPAATGSRLGFLKKH